MIRLAELTKRYSATSKPAVDSLDLDIGEGEIVVLVGPSGCGKTTTLKMINRLIEPTSGRIYLDGDDVTTIAAKELRRRIGYVIQQIGLFPHMTVADNIGITPRLLGWDKPTIRERTAELLNLIGLEPDTYLAKYPQQLSGGQQQRVGVARALAADPPVLLMDEPFGALDPISRSALQDELLRIQASVGKTIVFVTHDIDEAVKIGDRIVVMSEQAHIAQAGTPGELLNAPADDFVSDFVGEGASIRSLTLSRVGDIPVETPFTAQVSADQSDVRARLVAADRAAALLVDDRGRPVRWLDRDESAYAADPHTDADRTPALISGDATLHEAFDKLLAADDPLVVVAEDGSVLGTVSIEVLLAETRSTQRRYSHAEGRSG